MTFTTSGKSGLIWTTQAAAYGTGGLMAVLAGAYWGLPYLILLGGVACFAVIAEAAAAVIRLPKIQLSVDPKRIPEGNETRIRMETSGFRPHHQLHVALPPGLVLVPGNTNLLDGGQEASTIHEFWVQGPVRGPQRVGAVTLRSWSPNRLWAQHHAFGLHEDVEVVPRREDMQQVDLASWILKPTQGRFQINRPGQGFDFFSLREYQAGDTIRSINWKATARREDLIVNQRQIETHSEILILLDARSTMGVGPIGRTPLDRSCRLALTLFEESVASRDIARFLAYGDGIIGMPPGRTNQVWHLESLLAKLAARGRSSLADAWNRAKQEMKAAGPIIILSSLEADAAAFKAVSNMISRGHPVTVIAPRPSDNAWLTATPTGRLEAREASIQAVRKSGAIVFDWNPNAPVVAARPSRRNAFT